MRFDICRCMLHVTKRPTQGGSIAVALGTLAFAASVRLIQKPIISSAYLRQEESHHWNLFSYFNAS
ncbi:hypothetical protein PEC301937_40600 [Pectobacterium carotovorum subsp. carotovorum]|nr:hypothetical protein PEC301937_40600 [Pectobacterium carotovorum subsp. carotovorum]GLW40046.1 hypothetical protein Pcaca04_39820 [Pectobacterium carotovorum subsp. carotovorum]